MMAMTTRSSMSVKARFGFRGRGILGSAIKVSEIRLCATFKDAKPKIAESAGGPLYSSREHCG
jgi:hypothetical protein